MESKALLRKGLLIPAALAVGAAALSVLVHFSPVLPGDKEVLVAAREAELPLLDWLCRSLDCLGDRWIIVVSVVALSAVLWVRGRQREALACLLIIPLELMTLGLREIIDRPRPFIHFFPFVFPDLSTSPENSGFPSGTTLHAVLFFGFIAYVCQVYLRTTKVRRAVQAAFIFTIALVSYSRIYIGVHWPTDIVGAWLYGGFFLWFIIAVGLPAVDTLRWVIHPHPNLPPSEREGAK